MSYKGYYKPSYPRKYKGDPNNIIYRSLWERKFMRDCEMNENILELGSEINTIPYRSPVDNRYHRYFPDFYIKVKENNVRIKKILLKLNHINSVLNPKSKRERQRVISMKLLSMPKIRQNGMLPKNGV